MRYLEFHRRRWLFNAGSWLLKHREAFEGEVWPGGWWREVLCSACNQSCPCQPPKGVPVWTLDTDQNCADFRNTQAGDCTLALSLTTSVTLHRQTQPLHLHWGNNSPYLPGLLAWSEWMHTKCLVQGGEFGGEWIHVLGWPKIPLEFFSNIVWRNPSEHFGHANILICMTGLFCCAPETNNFVNQLLLLFSL